MEKGFTLIEMILAIFILSIAIIGVYSAFFVVIILTSNSVDRFTATYLAQEGVEIVRNIRDTNWLKCTSSGEDSCSWNSYITNAGAEKSPECEIDCSNGCQGDFTTNPHGVPETCLKSWGTEGDYLKTNTPGGSGDYFKYTDNADAKQSKFKRKIIVTPFTEKDYAVRVTVKVSWDEKANILSGGMLASECKKENCVTLEEILYNWY